MENASQMGRREWVISGRQGQLTSARTTAELHILVPRTALDSVLWADTHTELPGPPCRLRNVASGCGQTRGRLAGGLLHLVRFSRQEAVTRFLFP